MSMRHSRRQWLAQTTAAAAAAGCIAPLAQAAPASDAKAPVRFCLNTSTVRGQKLPITEVVDLAAKAGYQAIEPWMNELQQHASQGGSLSDLKKRISDAGLTVESAIGFAEWIVDDDARRAKGLEQARRDMDLVKQIGGSRIAAPPAGATKEPGLNLAKAAERYRALLDLGREIGVVPQVEVWGFSANLSRLGETTYVAIEAQHPDACILPDVYHLYKGGSEFEGLKMLSGSGVHVFHMNDYPADPPRATINDAARVFCGDGVAPLTQILKTLFAAGFHGVLSLELFNPEYYKQDPLTVMKTGLEKMQAAVAKARS